jgi:hypothetical protein
MNYTIFLFVKRLTDLTFVQYWRIFCSLVAHLRPPITASTIRKITKMMRSMERMISVENKKIMKIMKNVSIKRMNMSMSMRSIEIMRSTRSLTYLELSLSLPDSAPLERWWR